MLVKFFDGFSFNELVKYGIFFDNTKHLVNHVIQNHVYRKEIAPGYAIGGQRARGTDLNNKLTDECFHSCGKNIFI